MHSPGRARGEEPRLHWSVTRGGSDGDSQIQWATLFLGPKKAVPLFESCSPPRTKLLSMSSSFVFID